jgi:hypothetical protein
MIRPALALSATLALAACPSAQPLTVTAGPGGADAHECVSLALADLGYRISDESATARQIRAEREYGRSRSPLAPTEVDALVDRIDATVGSSGSTLVVSHVMRTAASARAERGNEQVSGPRDEARADAESVAARCL